jgi:hypothetical protein
MEFNELRRIMTPQLIFCSARCCKQIEGAALIALVAEPAVGQPNDGPSERRKGEGKC